LPVDRPDAVAVAFPPADPDPTPLDAPPVAFAWLKTVPAPPPVAELLAFATPPGPPTPPDPPIPPVDVAIAEAEPCSTQTGRAAVATVAGSANEGAAGSPEPACPA